MSYAAPQLWLPAPFFISSFSLESLGIPICGVTANSPASAAWASSNRTVYVPVRPFQDILVKRMFVLNGATVGTNTVTVALYSSDTSHLPVTRLVTASATSAGTVNTCQYFDITDTTLTGGVLYYMAMAINGTTATTFRTSLGVEARHLFFTGTTNCPDPATPAAAAANNLPVFGLDLRGTP